MSYLLHRLTTRTRALPAHLIRRGILLMVVVFVFGAAGEPGQALPVGTLPLLGGGGSATSAQPFEEFVLEIPEIGVSVQVQEAWVVGDTWDFSGFRQEAAHLELTAYPGQGSNVVIGAHYELANFVPGPFIALDQLQAGDRINVVFEGQTFTYEVFNTLQVHPSEVYVAYGTSQEMLTLLTCYSYDGQGRYARRYVVQARLVEPA